MRSQTTASAGISSIGVCLGEVTLNLDDLSRIHNVDREILKQNLDGRQVVVTKRSRTELALEAAELCLQQAGVSGADVDVIIDIHARATKTPEEGPPLASRLGAQRALVLSMILPCGMSMAAMQCALSWFLRPEVRHVLIIHAEIHPWEYRCAEPISDDYVTNMMSDGAAVALLDRGGEISLRSFAFATNNETWPLARHIQSGEDPTSKPPRTSDAMGMQVLKDFFDLTQEAFQRCVEHSGDALTENDTIITNAILPRSARSVLRRLRHSPAKRFDYEGRCHAYGADWLIALAALRARDVVPRRVYFGDIGFSTSSFASFAFFHGS